MNGSEQLAAFLSAVKDANVERDVPLAKHCTFRIGGNAAIYAQPKTEEMLLCIVRACKSAGVPMFFLGNGSNVLFSDAGFFGCVISTADLCKITLQREGTVFAQSGASLFALCRFAQRHALGGLAFAYGIPGTLGGALVMNAGAYGGQIADVIESVRAYDTVTDTICTLRGEALEFRYRHSVFSAGRYLILSAVLSLPAENAEEISAKMQQHLSARREKQPLEYPSAGSAFKHGDGFFTAELIDRAGLKGLRCGDAAVSEKHAGFIVNLGAATAKDVTELIGKIQAAVREKFGKEIECEICIVKER